MVPAVEKRSETPPERIERPASLLASFMVDMLVLAAMREDLRLDVLVEVADELSIQNIARGVWRDPPGR